MDAAVSVYPSPASSGMQEDLLALSTLRSLGASAALGVLRRRRYARAVFRLAEGDPPGIEAVARVVLGVMRAESKVIERPGGSIEPLSIPGLLNAFVGLATAGVLGLGAAVANAWDVRASREPVGRPVGPGRSVPYLRASFGLPRVGGSVGHTSGIVNALAEAGLEVSVFACAEPVGLKGRSSFTAVPLPRSATYPHELNAHRFGRRFFRACARSLSPRAVRFLYQRYAINDLSGVRLARRLRRPLVLEYNGSEVWAQKNWGRALVLPGLSRRIEVACLREADLVVTVSEPLERELLDLGLPAHRVLFYPNCVDAEVFDPARFDSAAGLRTRARFGLDPGDFVVTFVGTFGRWHGAEVLARAIKLLPEEFADRRLRFLFVGDGSTAPETRAILAAERVSERAVFAGPRPQAETPEILAASDAFASPHVPNPDGTAFFGSPTKLFEYMAMARPIVASDLDQIGRILRGWGPGSTADASGAPLAILVEPGEPAALAEGLLSAASLDPREAQRLGEAARAAILRSFRWEACVEAVVGRLAALDRERGA